jgi:hypothetical protein
VSREADVDETDFDGWADLGAQRRAEDEALVREYAAGEGRGLDMRPVRGFVQHVRRDIGPKGVICRVQMTMYGRGHEICVWFYFPGQGRPAAPQTATVTHVPTKVGDRPALASGLAALAQVSATPPVSPTRPPSAPATPGKTEPGTTTRGTTTSA